MFNPLKSLGDIKAMRDQAMAIQKQLQAEVVEVVKNNIRIVITGDQKIQLIETNGAPSDTRMVEAVNEAIKKSQEVAAKKLTQMSGGLGGLGNMLSGQNG